MPATNIHYRAQRHAWFIEFLTDYLDDGPGFNPKNPFMLSPALTEEEAEWIQSKIDNPPDHLDRTTLPGRILVPIADLVALATERDFELARALLAENKRTVA
jgi:hypothetical protein